MITRRKRMKRNLEDLRTSIFTFYANKYYNIFMNRFKFPTLDYQQRNFLMKRFWETGKIACFLLKETVGSDDAPNGILVFTDFAPTEFNIYDFPTKVTLINKRGVKWIPSSLQEVDKDVVLGFIQKNEKGISQFVFSLIYKIVECEMAIFQNLQANKTPLLIACSPEDEPVLRAIVDDMDETKPFIVIPSEYAERIKAFNSGAVYNVDKLYNYKCALENEIREFLGLENLGFGEKKEHLLVDEIAQNDQVTKQSGDTFYDSLLEFAERVEDTFGYALPIEIAEEELPAKENEEEEETQEDYD